MNLEEAKKYMDNDYYIWGETATEIVYWYGNHKIEARDITKDQSFVVPVLFTDYSTWCASWYRPKYGIYCPGDVIK